MRSCADRYRCLSRGAGLSGGIASTPSQRPHRCERPHAIVLSRTHRDGPDEVRIASKSETKPPTFIRRSRRVTTMAYGSTKTPST